MARYPPDDKHSIIACNSFTGYTTARRLHSFNFYGFAEILGGMNNRRAPRLRTFKSGTISLGDRSLDCLIRNVSTTGACLELKGTATIPKAFKLVIKPDNLFRTCKVVWQDGHRVGVLFEPGHTS